MFLIKLNRLNEYCKYSESSLALFHFKATLFHTDGTAFINFDAFLHFVLFYRAWTFGGNDENKKHIKGH